MSSAQAEEMQIPDVKKVLGCPKITFVLGGPASGKGTQCAKLVEEFGYTHISTGDLFRAEVSKGSREGEMMKRIMNEGGLIPYQLTVQVLVNAMIACPSKNYLIDGFPRAVDQAIYFEQVVGETQSVLYFNTPIDVCVARCLERAKTSNRTDDTEEVINNRLKTYEEQSKPVVEMYQKFGKVREVDGSGDTFSVWTLTRRAMLPQVTFLVGPMCSGKTALGSSLCQRTNAKLVNYGMFLKEQGLDSCDDDEQVLGLINSLAGEISPRVILEDFPRTIYQAKFFLKNACEPRNVFVLTCSKDQSQERMLQVPQKSENYLPSSLLSKKIGVYNKNMEELLPFLQMETNCSEISTVEAFNVSLKNMCACVEPTIVSVRSSGSKEATTVKNNVLNGLVQQGYVSLEVNDLIQLEVKRQTAVGLAIQELLNDRSNVWSEPGHIVTILKKIIYSGLDQNDKFLLIGFPDQIEHAQIFEDECALITAIVYTTDGAQPTVEIKGNDLSLKCMDSVFAKQFRLRTMTSWDANSFEDALGKKVQWGIVHGRQYSGAKEAAQQLVSIVKGKVINMKAISEDVRKKLGNEEEPFEGEVPIEKIEECILETISKDKGSNDKFCYIFDSWEHKDADSFFINMSQEFGLPNFLIHTDASKATVNDRYKKANEVDDIGEEAQAELTEAATKDETNQKEFEDRFTQSEILKKMHSVSTETMEGCNRALKNIFSPKVVLVNHEKRLDVDIVCSNLAIKYDFLYISVYQLIRQHIQEKSEMGKALLKCKKPKALNDSVRYADGADDEFEEQEYSACHFDLKLVLQMLRETLIEKRTTQQYILLEGLCNGRKLENDNDRWALRSMDELFQIEKCLGEIAGCISLQYKCEPVSFAAKDKEERVEAVVEEKKVEILKDEDGNEIDPPQAEAAAEEGEENAKPKFNPKDYEWTVTNKDSRNLPQLFADFKAHSLCEEKASVSFDDVATEAVCKCLDEFCARVIADQGCKYIYQQVVFQE